MKNKTDNKRKWNRPPPYGAPQTGINPLTGKPLGPYPIRDVTKTGFTSFLAIISVAEPEVEDQTPPTEGPTT